VVYQTPHFKTAAIDELAAARELDSVLGEDRRDLCCIGFRPA
jgi:hypothetical protein